MLKKASFLLIALLSTAAVTTAQESLSATHREELTTMDMPQWLVDFSNLPRDDREQYLRAFNNAKRAYQQGQWVACYGFLADCEMIFNQNPNVWNLRACCLMEQKYLDEAAAELEKVRKVLPNDPVTVLNLANLHLATGKHEESIEVIDNLLPRLPENAPAELRNVLIYRKVLSLVLLNRTEDAREVVKHLTALSDTPLYYYSQAAFALAEGNKMGASRYLRIAHNIYSKGNSTVPYQRALELSQLGSTAPSSQ